MSCVPAPRLPENMTAMQTRVSTPTKACIFIQSAPSR